MPQGTKGKEQYLIHRHNVGYTITRVNDDTSQQTLGIQGQYGLNGDVDALETVGLEHGLNHLLSVLLGVHGGLGQKNLAALGVDLHLLKEGVVPNVEGVLPVSYNTVIQRVGDLKHRSEFGGFITNHDVFNFYVLDLLFEPHDGAADHRREDGSGEVGTSKTAFYKAGTVIANNCGAHA